MPERLSSPGRPRVGLVSRDAIRLVGWRSEARREGGADDPYVPAARREVKNPAEAYQKIPSLV